MITRVVVRSPEDMALHKCELGGFGMTICGNCGAVLKHLVINAHCTGCGAAVVEIERVGDRFEGDAA